MGSEAAPHFTYDHGLSNPATANYYGYYCTGVEAPGKWDGNHNVFGLDGQHLHFSADGSQNVYYTSNYGYSQLSYNPYSHCPIVGTQQHITDPTYHQPISSPYLPIPLSSGADMVSRTSPESLVYANYAYVPGKPDIEFVLVPNPVTSSTTPVNSQRAVLSNLSLEYAPSASHQFNASSKPSEGPAFNLALLGQSLPYGAVPPGRLPYVTQPQARNYFGSDHASEHLVSGRAPFEHFSNSKQSITNGLKHKASDPHKPTSIEKTPSTFQSENFSNCSSRNRVRGQWNSRITVKAYTSKVEIGNPQGTIIISADQYNKGNFPVDYPCSKFFVIKSYSEDDVHKSVKYNVWSSTPNGNKKLNTAYEDARMISAGKPWNCPVFLFFSVNGSGHFCGVAEMVGPVDFEKDMDFWQQDTWTGSFPVKWHIIKDVPNTSFRQILLENNENKPVTHSRDTQEITHLPGSIMLKIFKNSPMKESILNDFIKYEELEKKSQRRPNILSYDAPIFVPSFASQHANILSDRRSGTDTVQDGIASNPWEVAETQQNSNSNQSLQPDEQQLKNHLTSCSLRQKEGHILAEQSSSEGCGIRNAHSAAVQQPKANGKPLLDACNQLHKEGENTSKAMMNHPSDSSEKLCCGPSQISSGQAFAVDSKQYENVDRPKSSAIFQPPTKENVKADQPETDGGEKENGIILQPAEAADNTAGKSSVKRGGKKHNQPTSVLGTSLAPIVSEMADGICDEVQTDGKSDHEVDPEENFGAESVLNCPVEVVTIGSMHVRVKKPPKSRP